MGALMERKVSEITSRRSRPPCCTREAGNPGSLHLRQGGHFAQAAEHEGRHRMGAGGKALTAAATEPVVKKYLVHDQRQAMLAAHFFDRSPFRWRVKCPVGLLGWTTAMARVREVTRRRSASRSRCQP